MGFCLKLIDKGCPEIMKKKRLVLCISKLMLFILGDNNCRVILSPVKMNFIIGKVSFNHFQIWCNLQRETGNFKDSILSYGHFSIVHHFLTKRVKTLKEDNTLLSKVRYNTLQHSALALYMLNIYYVSTIGQTELLAFPYIFQSTLMVIK